MMRKPIALLLSLILSLSINSTVAFAAPEPVKASTGMTDNSLTDELVMDPMSTIDSSNDSLTELNLSPVPVPDSDTKAVQGQNDGTTLDSSVLEDTSTSIESIEPTATKPFTQETTTSQLDSILIEKTEVDQPKQPIEEVQWPANIKSVQEYEMIQDSPSKETVQTKEGASTSQGVKALDFAMNRLEAMNVTPFQVNKTIVPTGKGGYMIRLEVYATSDIADAVQKIFTSYNKQKNSVNYDSRENFWFMVEEDVYVPAWVKRIPEKTLTIPPASSKNDYFYKNRYKIFEKLKNGSYDEVIVEKLPNDQYKYTFSDKTMIIRTGNVTPNLGRSLYIGNSIFIYSYTTAGGAKVEVGRATGPNKKFGVAFFQRKVEDNSTNPYQKVFIEDSISDYFDFPGETGVNNILVKTAAYIGENSFGPEVSDSTGTVGITNIDKSIQIKGFDFLTNYVRKVTNPDQSVSWQGKKLIVEYPLIVRPGFLGGNNVPVSGDNSGVFLDIIGIEEFPIVTLNIAIPPIDIQLPTRNVYRSGSLTRTDLEQKAVVQVGESVLNLAPEALNFGLDEWQTDFVEIQKKLSTGSLENMLADLSYTLEVSITAPGSQTKQKSTTADIKVFQPKLVFKDITIWMGEAVPSQSTLLECHIKTQWINKNVNSTDPGVLMSGVEPTPILQFELPECSLENGLIATKKDIPVGVTLTIGSIQEKLNEPGLVLKVKTSQVTIKKTGGKDDETYIFNIRKGGAFYLSVSLTGNSAVTIYDLPVGTYSVEEEAAWSWRNFSGFDGSSTASVKLTGSDAGSRATVISTNTGIKNNKWLNDYSDVSKNDKINIVLLEWNPAWTEIKRNQIIG